MEEPSSLKRNRLKKNLVGHDDATLIRSSPDGKIVCLNYAQHRQLKQICRKLRNKVSFLAIKKARKLMLKCLLCNLTVQASNIENHLMVESHVCNDLKAPSKEVKDVAGAYLELDHLRSKVEKNNPKNTKSQVSNTENIKPRLNSSKEVKDIDLKLHQLSLKDEEKPVTATDRRSLKKVSLNTAILQAILSKQALSNSTVHKKEEESKVLVNGSKKDEPSIDQNGKANCEANSFIGDKKLSHVAHTKTDRKDFTNLESLINFNTVAKSEKGHDSTDFGRSNIVKDAKKATSSFVFKSLGVSAVSEIRKASRALVSKDPKKHIYDLDTLQFVNHSQGSQFLSLLLTISDQVTSFLYKCHPNFKRLRFICRTCDKSFSANEEAERHVESPEHQLNFEFFDSETFSDPIIKECTWEFLKLSQEQNSFRCSLCNVNLGLKFMGWMNHLQSVLHSVKLESLPVLTDSSLIRTLGEAEPPVLVPLGKALNSIIQSLHWFYKGKLKTLVSELDFQAIFFLIDFTQLNAGKLVLICRVCAKSLPILEVMKHVASRFHSLNMISPLLSRESREYVDWCPMNKNYSCSLCNLRLTRGADLFKHFQNEFHSSIQAPINDVDPKHSSIMCSTISNKLTPTSVQHNHSSIPNNVSVDLTVLHSIQDSLKLYFPHSVLQFLRLNCQIGSQLKCFSFRSEPKALVIVCNLCNIPFTDVETATEHVRDKKHLNNVSGNDGKAPGNPDVPSIHDDSWRFMWSFPDLRSYFCTVCNVALPHHTREWIHHFQSEAHGQALREVHHDLLTAEMCFPILGSGKMDQADGEEAPRQLVQNACSLEKPQISCEQVPKKVAQTVCKSDVPQVSCIPAPRGVVQIGCNPEVPQSLPMAHKIQYENLVQKLSHQINYFAFGSHPESDELLLICKVCDKSVLLTESENHVNNQEHVQNLFFATENLKISHEDWTWLSIEPINLTYICRLCKKDLPDTTQTWAIHANAKTHLKKKRLLGGGNMTPVKSSTSKGVSAADRRETNPKSKNPSGLQKGGSKNIVQGNGILGNQSNSSFLQLVNKTSPLNTGAINDGVFKSYKAEDYFFAFSELPSTNQELIRKNSPFILVEERLGRIFCTACKKSISFKNEPKGSSQATMITHFEGGKHKREASIYGPETYFRYNASFIKFDSLKSASCILCSEVVWSCSAPLIAECFVSHFECPDHFHVAHQKFKAVASSYKECLVTVY